MKSFYISVLIAIAASLPSCSKQAFLDAKPSSSFVVPSSIANFQALLDHAYMIETPELGETSADNYYISDYQVFQTLALQDQNTYIWASDIFAGQGDDPDWNEQYQNVLTDNVILEGLTSISRATDPTDYDNIKGQALFNRAYEFYNLSQVFAPVFDSSTAGTDLGIPLKLTSDIKANVPRASVAATYQQIISDLVSSENLLSTTVPATYRNRPSKPAVFAMLARVYLSMRAYHNAQLYSDSSLQLYNTLMDYNLNTNTTTTPFTNLNLETIYQSNIYSAEQVLYNLRFQEAGFSVDTTLYRSYAANDLRSYFYFVPKSTTSIFTKSSYSGTTYFFSGLATDELYLVRAECNARQGNVGAAMNDLNTLLTYRWKTGTFTQFTATSANQALSIILTERRKELLLRGLRWTDLRRLNKEGMNITLTRILNGQTYSLLPNSNLYTLPIPPDVITEGGYTQNLR